MSSRETLPSDVLQPSLQQEARADLRPERRPWRLASQFWVAILGGPLSVAAVAYANAGRLGLPARRRQAILAIGIGASALVVAGAALWIGGAGLDAALSRQLRLVSRVAGAVVYGACYLLQRTGDRLYAARTPHAELYGPLWVHGGIAIFAGGILLGAAVAAASWLATRGAVLP